MQRPYPAIWWWCRFTSAILVISVAVCLPADRIVMAAMPDEPASDENQNSNPEESLDNLKTDDEKGQIRDESEALDPANKDALAWYMAGQKAMKRGDLQPAADAFEKAAEASPKSAIPLRALALVLLRMGRTEEGTKTAKKAIELDPDDFEMRLQLAVFFATTQQVKESVVLLNEALESKTLKRKSREFVQLHQVRAAVFLALRNLKEAADSYEVILEALERPEDFSLTDREHKALVNNRPTSYETVGRVLMEVGRHDKAIQAFEALGRIQKDQPGEHNLLVARAYFLQDKLQDCEKNLDSYFESGRRTKESLQILMDLYRATNRSDSISDRLKELSENTADATTVRMFLGQVLLDQGKAVDARDVYQAILDSTGDSDAYLGLVRVEIIDLNPSALIATINRAARSPISVEELVPLIVSITTNEEFAKNTVTTCLEMNAEKPGDLHPAVPYFCALIAEPLKMQKEAAELFKAAVELNPDRQLMVQILDKYGVNQLALGEFAMAIKIMEQQLEIPGLPPGDRINTLFRLSAAYASNEDIESARRVLKEALRMVPDEPQLLTRLARVEAADGKLEVAEGLLEKAVKGIPKDSDLLPDTLILLASILARQEKWDSAIDQYLRAMDCPTIDKETLRLVRMALSNTYVQSGEMAKGEKVMEEIYAEDPNDPGVNNDLGYLYADQGKELERAEKMIRIAVEAQPENPAYLDSLGWVLFRQGKNEEALEPLKKANSDPKYRDATLLEHQADVHQALEQTKEAQDLWLQALKVEQDSTKPDEKVVERLKSKLGDAAPAEEKPKE
ncbi:MAG TPA: tetratricopeptide repeat protein [Planctomycetaceae bacterium]|nr:tetratricopeptide repeat protein [Planctomycetaceae bacterium]